MPNKYTSTVKQAILWAFNEMGGAEELLRWGKLARNRKEFYKLAARLIPMEVVGPGQNGEHLSKVTVVHEHYQGDPPSVGDVIDVQSQPRQLPAVDQELTESLEKMRSAQRVERPTAPARVPAAPSSKPRPRR